MRINLHSLILAPAVLAAAAFTAQPASAAATYRVHVPFNFEAAGKSLPAGDYVVRQGDRSYAVALEGKSTSMTWMLRPGDPNPNDRSVVLTFDKIGQNHMLRTVQVGPAITARIDKKYVNSMIEEEQIRGGE